MNVLLTSIGQRAYLAHYFRDALKGRGQIIAVGVHPDAPGMYAADLAVVAPPAGSAEYLPFLLELCREHDIGLLCALHDLDVYHLSQHRDLLEAAGVANVLPDSDWARLSLDKHACSQMLAAAGIASPWTGLSLDETREALLQGTIEYPLILKARFGFGSLGLHVCRNSQELYRAWDQASRQVEAALTAWPKTPKTSGGNLVIQPYVAGREICIGLVHDLKGMYQGQFACHIHRMRNGESQQAVSISRDVTAALAETLSALTGHRGIWGIDCIEHNDTLHVIDINPRFSGDYPFHHLCGADVPAALIAWAKGQRHDTHWLDTTPGLRTFKELSPRLVGNRKNH